MSRYLMALKKWPQRCAGRGLVGHPSFHNARGDPARFQNPPFLKMFPATGLRGINRKPSASRCDLLGRVASASEKAVTALVPVAAFCWR
jgi:hypothetical protein